MAPRVALIHDFLLDLRGAERVFAAICDAWPEADIFAAVYDEAGTEGRFADRTIHTSFLQRLHPTSRTFRPLLPLYPHAVESFDLRGYDTVISSSSAWAHGVLVDPGAVHVCYCHNPFRYAWSEREATLEARGPVVRRRCGSCSALAPVGLDRRAARRPLRLQLEHHGGARRRYFGRESTVLHPPVELHRFTPGQVGAHYVVLAELMAHKRIDVAIEAFNRSACRSSWSGTGPRGTAAAARGAERHASPAGSRIRRSPRCSPARRAIVVTARRGVRHRRGRGARRGPAGDRVRRRRGARERAARRHRRVLRAQRPGGAGRDRAAFDALGVDSAACRAAAERFSVPRFQSGLAAIVADAVSDERPPRPEERPVLAAGLLNGGRRAGRRAEPARRWSSRSGRPHQRTDWEALASRRSGASAGAQNPPFDRLLHRSA